MIKLSRSMEDYLEAVWVVGKRKKIVRVKDLMAYFGYKVSSVNNALKVLTGKGLVAHERYGHIELTTLGQKEALRIYGRHQTIADFLVKVLRIGRSTAEQDACRIEHHVQAETYFHMKKFLAYQSTAGRHWLDGFQKYLKGNKR